jgi:hypothetical protein
MISIKQLGFGAVPALTAVAAVWAMSPAAAQSDQTRAATVHLAKSPFSGGVLMAQALRAGKVHLSGHAPAGPSAILKCSPAPCTLPNKQASEGGQPVDETPISVDPNNAKHVLTAGNDYNCSPSLQGYYASTNGGNKWTATCGLLAASAVEGEGDPVVGWDLNGIAYRGGIDAVSDGSFVIVIGTSADFGKTWNTPVVAAQASDISMDKPWLEVDTSVASPRKNALYVSMTQFYSNNDSQIGVSHSIDGGHTWKLVNADKRQVYPEIDQFSDLAIGKDGTVYLSWMRCRANSPSDNCGGTKASMYTAKSTDGGMTWSKAVKIQVVNLAPDTCGAFYGCLPNTNERISNIPVIAIDNANDAFAGKLYVIDYNWTGKYMKVQVNSSVDGGATWSKPVGVAPKSDKHDQFFPWINVSGNGLVGPTWLDRRNDSANVNYDSFGAASTDGGITYPNVQLSTASSNPFNDGFGSGFMGDYTGNAWAGEKLFASWSDTRNGSDTQDEVGGLIP